MIKTLYRPCPKGVIRAVPSKSHVHRALICASMADGTSMIACRETCADTLATAECLTALGAGITFGNETFTVVTKKMENNRPGPTVLRCGESGSTLRFLIPYALAKGRDSVFMMEGRLPDRPLSGFKSVLEEHGGRFCSAVRGRLLVEGKIFAGEYSVDGTLSSQFASGIMMALGGLESVSVVHISGKKASAPYLDLTMDTMRQFGARADVTENSIIVGGGYFPAFVKADGDWSNAAFILCAGAMSDGEASVSGLDISSVQGDRKILEILGAAGAVISENGDVISVSRGNMKGFETDAEDTPDLVPVTAALAAACNGKSVIYNCSRLRHKESDRVESVCTMIRSLGGDIRTEEDRIIIYGTGSLMGGNVSSYGDHRIAMAAAAASCICKNEVSIEGAEAVGKSYPGFWDDFGVLCE